MTPEEIKAQVQSAYIKALENRNVQRFRSSNLASRFRDVRLYGREAGVDFATTHLDEIVNEALETAGCKANMLEIMCHGFGHAALGGFADTLRELTALKIEVAKWAVRLIWAENHPGLV